MTEQEQEGLTVDKIIIGFLIFIFTVGIIIMVLALNGNCFDLVTGGIC